jgi:2-polyprenyl-3-methyl-5-hydroxy-6-metoxy-1,4-benzoquinol methylase
MRKDFDKAYYDRFYRDPRTRAVTPAGARRQAQFIAAYLRYLDIPVERILDIGCGVGTTLRALGRAFPRAHTHGVEVSDYLCDRYGWERGSVVDYQARRPYDLVVCNDVLAYLDDRDCSQALANLASLTRGAAFLGILSREDAGQYDPRRTDRLQYRRPAAWYRRRLRPGFVCVGGGLYLLRPLRVTVWTMDRVD